MHVHVPYVEIPSRSSIDLHLNARYCGVSATLNIVWPVQIDVSPTFHSVGQSAVSVTDSLVTAKKDGSIEVGN